MTIDSRFEFACRTAKSAGRSAHEYFLNYHDLTVQSKGVQDMMSEADIKTEALIRDAVEKEYSEDQFFGEESGYPKERRPNVGLWIVDPIDGTQAFVNGIPNWCVSIAFYVDGQVRLGVVYDPIHDELFAAQQGRGAFLNDVPIHASAATSVSEGLVSVGFSNRVRPDQTLEPLGRLIRASGMYHRNGSGALSLVYVAAGRLVGYFEPHINSWDIAAATLIVREAEGLTNDVLKCEYSLINGGPIVSAAPGVYEELLHIVGDVEPW